MRLQRSLVTFSKRRLLSSRTSCPSNVGISTSTISSLDRGVDNIRSTIPLDQANVSANWKLRFESIIVICLPPEWRKVLPSCLSLMQKCSAQISKQNTMRLMVCAWYIGNDISVMNFHLHTLSSCFQTFLSSSQIFFTPIESINSFGILKWRACDGVLLLSFVSLMMPTLLPRLLCGDLSEDKQNFLVMSYIRYNPISMQQSHRLGLMCWEITAH